MYLMREVITMLYRNRHQPRGESHYRSTLTAEAVRQLCADHLAGVDIHQLAAKYNSNYQTIRRILTGNSWRSVTNGVDIYRRLKPDIPRDGHRKLTRTQVDMLRELYPVCRVSESEWGALLGISQPSVSDIVHHRTYQYRDGE